MSKRDKEPDGLGEVWSPAKLFGDPTARDERRVGAIRGPCDLNPMRKVYLSS